MNALNKSFGKLLQDGTLEYAPDSFNWNSQDYIHPTPADYIAAGFKPVVFLPPSAPAPDGYHYASDGWEVVNDEIHNKWKLVEDPYVPRTFSKMKIVAALTSMNVWEQTKAWIESEGLYDLYLAAQDFAEDNDYFKAGVQALQTQLHLTDEQVEQILSQCILEG